MRILFYSSIFFSVPQHAGAARDSARRASRVLVLKTHSMANAPFGISPQYTAPNSELYCHLRQDVSSEAHVQPGAEEDQVAGAHVPSPSHPDPCHVPHHQYRVIGCSPGCQQILEAQYTVPLPHARLPWGGFAVSMSGFCGRRLPTDVGGKFRAPPDLFWLWNHCCPPQFVC